MIYESHSQRVKYWRSGFPWQHSNNTVFDELEMRLEYQLLNTCLMEIQFKSIKPRLLIQSWGLILQM